MSVCVGGFQECEGVSVYMQCVKRLTLKYAIYKPEKRLNRYNPEAAAIKPFPLVWEIRVSIILQKIYNWEFLR